MELNLMKFMWTRKPLGFKQENNEIYIETKSYTDLWQRTYVTMKNASVHGDQYVTVEIQVPKYLNQEAKEKLKEYQRACA